MCDSVIFNQEQQQQQLPTFKDFKNQFKLYEELPIFNLKNQKELAKEISSSIYYIIKKFKYQLSIFKFFNIFKDTIKSNDILSSFISIGFNNEYGKENEFSLKLLEFLVTDYFSPYVYKKTREFKVSDLFYRDTASQFISLLHSFEHDNVEEFKFLLLKEIEEDYLWYSDDIKSYFWRTLCSYDSIEICKYLITNFETRLVFDSQEEFNQELLKEEEKEDNDCSYSPMFITVQELFRLSCSTMVAYLDYKYSTILFNDPSIKELKRNNRENALFILNDVKSVTLLPLVRYCSYVRVIKTVEILTKYSILINELQPLYSLVTSPHLFAILNCRFQEIDTCKDLMKFNYFSNANLKTVIDDGGDDDVLKAFRKNNRLKNLQRQKVLKKVNKILDHIKKYEPLE